MEEVNAMFETIESSLKKVNEKISGHDARFALLEKKMDDGRDNFIVPPRWEQSFKVEVIPEFYGTTNPSDYLDWEGIVDYVFTAKDVSDDKQVPNIATRFRDRLEQGGRHINIVVH
ncbi:hypothetical protein FRX31_002394 [Thalictrum thalictroides]|uniref:Uncharacterized protein n=1 Tax=Thalictrum thalictroides TaxID=46969 RepID=A0A7J6XEN0_THATH|nr:hypothetical protein FRX31_002394 [Thalictrum thalictroides]